MGRDLAAGLILTALNLSLYRKIVRLWFTWDDSFTLRLAIDRPFRDAFLDGKLWPQRMYTPLLPSVFELDLALFRLDAARYYAVHLLVAIIASLSVYAAARLFFAVGPAFCATVVFAAGVPVCAVVTQLSTVHYLIAIAFCAFAVMAWRFALERTSAWMSALSATFFLFALLAKEFAAPLPVLLLALPVHDLRSRVRHLIGQFAVLPAYLVWRRSLLGSFFGAYGWAVESHEWPMLIAQLPWKLIRESEPLLVLAVAVVIAAGLRTRRGWLVLLLALTLTVSPYLPLAKDIHRRYALVPWLTMSIAFAVAAGRIRHRHVRAALLAGMPILTILANRREWSGEFRHRLRLSDENRVFFDLPAGSLMRNPATPWPQMSDLNWVRTNYLGKPEGAACFYDDFFLCANDVRGRRVWQYDAAKRTVVEITDETAALTKRHCSAINMTAPLSAYFRHRDATLHWELGPYQDGRYTAITGNGLQSGEISRRNALYLPGMNGVTMRIRYDSPQGWTTYSPELALDFVREPEFIWLRCRTDSPDQQPETQTDLIEKHRSHVAEPQSGADIREDHYGDADDHHDRRSKDAPCGQAARNVARPEP